MFVIREILYAHPVETELLKVSETNFRLKSIKTTELCEEIFAWCLPVQDRLFGVCSANWR
jgi:hypothetical protein